MADLDYNTLSSQLFRPETIEAMMLPPLEAENSGSRTVAVFTAAG